MLDSIRFVQGAVAKKDYAPELTHFNIENGRIKGYNGMLALSGPIDMDINVSPKAVPFVKAIRTCKGTIELFEQPNGKLVVKSGRFKALVECAQEDFPKIEPEGERIDAPEGLLTSFKKLQPFIAEDASREWACGILLDGNSAFATNNVILAQYWMTTTFPVRVCVPRSAVAEVVRINESPIAVQIGKSNITFHFENERWLRAQLLNNEWPDIARLLDTPGEPTPIPDGFFEAVEDLLPFGDEIARVYFNEGTISTCPDKSSGAIIELDGLPEEGCFSAKYLKLLKGIAESVDFAAYPKPCLFHGQKVRGVIIGVRI
jgi:DNA polymerase III sliding clamp (beta) subunit (PCNA family)